MIQRAQALAFASLSFALATSPLALLADESSSPAVAPDLAATAPAAVPVREIPGDLRTHELGVELGDDPGVRGLEWTGELHLPPTADVDPATTTLTVSLASGDNPAFETTVPAGALRRRSETVFRFESTLPSGSRLAVRLCATGDGVWDFRIAAERVPVLLSNHSAMTASLAIGDAVAAERISLEDQGDRLGYRWHVARAGETSNSESASWVTEPATLPEDGADAPSPPAETASSIAPAAAEPAPAPAAPSPVAPAEPAPAVAAPPPPAVTPG